MEVSNLGQYESEDEGEALREVAKDPQREQNDKILQESLYGLIFSSDGITLSRFGRSTVFKHRLKVLAHLEKEVKRSQRAKARKEQEQADKEEDEADTRKANEDEKE